MKDHRISKAAGVLAAIVSSAMVLAPLDPALAQSQRECAPVSERTGEAGCWIIASVPLGELPQRPMFWHVDSFPTRAAAEAVKLRGGAVVEALGKTWLFTIGEAGYRPAGGVHVAEIGPLPVKSGKYTAQYMEAVLAAGTTTIAHRHPGPEAWYTTAGEVCLETPTGSTVGRAGGGVIVPAGTAMKLTASGVQPPRSLGLILHETARPWTIPASDWTPKGLCK
jgi:quercetin dioxygenase-like cupin family protein